MSRKLKEILEDKGVLVLPGVYDGLSAVAAKAVGFEALYMTGAGVAYSTLGLPDVGLLTQTEMAEKARYICEAADLPVVADGDTGYGNYLNVIRTVKLFEKAGVSCIQLEDQVMPKRCGHMNGKELVPAEEMVSKLQAACDTRSSEDFLIMARTDARAVYGLEEAIRRAHLYLEVGADILFIEAPQSEEEMRAICKEFSDVPLLANMVEGGKTPLRSKAELEDIGYKIALYPGACGRVVSKALVGLYSELFAKGDTKDYLDHMYIFGELNRLVGLDEIKALENKYKA